MKAKEARKLVEARFPVEVLESRLFSRITRAASAGQTSCSFDFPGKHQASELKRKLIKLGYAVQMNVRPDKSLWAEITWKSE